MQSQSQHQAIVVVGLGFGDCGKGTLTDALVRHHDAGLVVRYNGGAQAAHTVVTEDGRKHTFHQFGSGSFVPGVETFLAEPVLFNPLLLFWEEEDLQRVGVPDAFARLFVDRDARVTTPYHGIANRLREFARGDGRHGSCGLGIGETVVDAMAHGGAVLRVGDLTDPDRLQTKLAWHRALKQRELDDLVRSAKAAGDLPATIEAAIQELYSDDELEATVEVYEYIANRIHIVAGTDFLRNRLACPGATVFEGAQGVLLDQDWGFHPHTTWSDTTSENALALLKAADFSGHRTVLGALRAYQTRHGAGPLPTEDAALTQALPDRHNPTNAWQGSFRVGWFDLPLTRYALRVAGRIDALAITCLDQIAAHETDWKVAIGYRLNGKPFPLIPGERERLEQREALGIALRSVEVEYAPAPRCPERYAAWLSEEIGLPLAVTSWGPTAADKRFTLAV